MGVTRFTLAHSAGVFSLFLVLTVAWSTFVLSFVPAEPQQLRHTGSPEELTPARVHRRLHGEDDVVSLVQHPGLGPTMNMAAAPARQSRLPMEMFVTKESGIDRVMSPTQKWFLAAALTALSMALFISLVVCVAQQGDGARRSRYDPAFNGTVYGEWDEVEEALLQEKRDAIRQRERLAIQQAIKEESMMLEKQKDIIQNKSTKAKGAKRLHDKDKAVLLPAKPPIKVPCPVPSSDCSTDHEESADTNKDGTGGTCSIESTGSTGARESKQQSCDERLLHGDIQVPMSLPAPELAPPAGKALADELASSVPQTSTADAVLDASTEAASLKACLSREDESMLFESGGIGIQAEASPVEREFRLRWEAKEARELELEREDARRKGNTPNEQEDGRRKRRAATNEAVARALLSLHRRYGPGGSEPDFQGLAHCLLTLRTYLSNLVRAPQDAKYHCIRCNGSAFHTRVAAFDGAVAVLEACGFRRQGGDDGCTLAGGSGGEGGGTSFNEEVLVVDAACLRSRGACLRDALVKIDVLLDQVRRAA